MKNPIDLKTFGDSPASINLVKILIERKDPKLSRSVSVKIHEITRHLNNIDIKSDSKDTRRLISILMKKEAFRRVDESSLPDKIIKDHMKSVLNMYIRKFLKRDGKHDNIGV